MIKIEKGIPLPVKPNRYPWDDMEVGDSFFIAGKNTSEIGGHVSNARRRLGFDFTSRTVDGGTRIWRIS